MNQRTRPAVAVDQKHGKAYLDFPDAPEAYGDAVRESTLQHLFVSAVTHAQDRINWYDDKAGTQSRTAKRIRIASLVFFAGGTLAPIVIGMVDKLARLEGPAPGGPARPYSWAWIASLPWAEIGYVLLAFAGALVIFDQFFDASGSWMRYRQSQARLEVLLADLRFGWAELLTQYGEQLGERATAVRFVRLLRSFVTRVELLAEEETQNWARRFNERIEAFDHNPNLRIRLDATSRDSGPAPGAASDLPTVPAADAGAVPGAVATAGSAGTRI